LLDEKSIQDSFCLIRSDDHTIRIGYNGQSWIIYNANDDHSGPAPIHTVVKTKKQLVKKIFSFLGTRSVCVEVASLDEDKEINFSDYNQFMKDNPLTILRDRGLHLIAWYDQKLLLQLLNLAKTPDGKLIRSAIAASLVKQAKHNRTGMFFITIFAPEALTCLLELVDKSDEGLAILSAIIKTLTMNDDENWNGLHLIASFAPASLSELLGFVDETREGLALRSAIIKALKQKTITNNSTALLHVVDAIPSYIPLILRTIFPLNQKNFETLCCILEAFDAPNSLGQTAWERFLKASSGMSMYVQDEILVKELHKLSTFQLMKIKRQLLNKNKISVYPTFFNGNDSISDFYKFLIKTLNNILLNKSNEKIYNEETNVTIYNYNLSYLLKP
jgi:hypothetical protein